MRKGYPAALTLQSAGLLINGMRAVHMGGVIDAALGWGKRG